MIRRNRPRTSWFGFFAFSPAIAMSAMYCYRSLAFPEEIIHVILDHNLRPTHREFFGPGCRETINRRRKLRSLGPAAPPPCSAALLVCKRWLRIGTPLLYESVKISCLGDTKAVLEAVRANKDIAKFIRRLRLEGGYGKALGELSKYLHNVEHLFFSPDAKCRESITGLHIAFPKFNLRTLKLEDRRKIINRNTTYINGILEHSIRFEWPNLVCVNDFCLKSYSYISPFQKQVSFDLTDNTSREVVTALQEAPALEELVLSEQATGFWMFAGQLSRILENPSIKRITCHDQRFESMNDEYIRGRITGLSEEDKAKLEFVGAPQDPPM